MNPAAAKPALLSKSRYMRGVQCAKALYLGVYHRELEPPVSRAQQALFDQGQEVGRLARERLFPGGVFIDAKPWESRLAIARTRDAIAGGARRIYEASFGIEGAWARVDILALPESRRSWDLIEVKSSTSVKEEHLEDLACQAYIAEQAGLEVGRLFLVHLNKQCVAPGLEDLFVQAEVTQDVKPLLGRVGSRLDSFGELLARRQVPAIDIGPHCDSPYACPFQAHCFAEKHLPNPSVLDLPRFRERGWELYRSGILELSDPRLKAAELGDLQKRALEVTLSGRRFVDAEAIRQGVSSWKWPLYFLDFETRASAVPKFTGTRPYQQIPFQYSLHLELERGRPLTHGEYLHPKDTDPRHGLAESLLSAIGTEGSIVAYNARFEAGCLKALAEHLPAYRSRLEAVIARLVDPLPILREAVYDPAFLGSFSIKKVAPALLGADLSYEGLEVGDGEMAQLAYAEMVHPESEPGRREELRRALLEYCRQDTYAMVLLVRWMLNEL